MDRETAGRMDGLTPPWRARVARSRGLLAFELACVAGVFAADHYHLIFLSKTPYLLALAWLSLAFRGIGWREAGFRLDARWRRWLVLGVAAGLGMEGLELFVTQPALVALTGQPPDLSDFEVFRRSWKMYAVAVTLSWTLAALGEELVWRGWLLNRVRGLFGDGRWAWGAALAVTSLAFGLAHADQGITGMIENTLNGALLGGLYLATGRNLLAPIVAHGVTDTADFSLMFAGLYPGL